MARDVTAEVHANAIDAVVTFWPNREAVQEVAIQGGNREEVVTGSVERTQFEGKMMNLNIIKFTAITVLIKLTRFKEMVLIKDRQRHTSTLALLMYSTLVGNGSQQRFQFHFNRVYLLSFFTNINNFQLLWESNHG